MYYLECVFLVKETQLTLAYEEGALLWCSELKRSDMWLALVMWNPGCHEIVKVPSLSLSYFFVLGKMANEGLTSHSLNLTPGRGKRLSFVVAEKSQGRLISLVGTPAHS